MSPLRTVAQGGEQPWEQPSGFGERATVSNHEQPRRKLRSNYEQLFEQPLRATEQPCAYRHGAMVAQAGSW